eukprot:6113931-Amphidinium_carterae.1
MEKALLHYGRVVPKAVPSVGEEELARRSGFKRIEQSGSCFMNRMEAHAVLDAEDDPGVLEQRSMFLEPFRKRASEEFKHIKFMFVEAGATGFSQPAHLAMKVFKSEAKSPACAAYARDVLNMTDAVGLVKPKAAQLRTNFIPSLTMPRSTSRTKTPI